MGEPRFEFGQNWKRFAESITESQILCAIDSLQQVVGNLHGKTFLDIGCGSGIHSLAAVRLGATRVHSFDYDPKSVECAQRLKAGMAPDSRWTIDVGSALDTNYLSSLGTFDVVYAWGALHHTGDLWTALALAAECTNELLVISVYNDQGLQSRIWAVIKRRYNQYGAVRRTAIEAATFILIWGRHAVANIVRLHPLQTLRTWRSYALTRGMSPWVDLRDWAGGYPFEVARPDAVVGFYEARGFCLKSSKLAGKGHGCNEYVFGRVIEPAQR